MDIDVGGVVVDSGRSIGVDIVVGCDVVYKDIGFDLVVVAVDVDVVGIVVFDRTLVVQC